jgi:hypothetical protein
VQKLTKKTFEFLKLVSDLAADDLTTQQTNAFKSWNERSVHEFCCLSLSDELPPLPPLPPPH